MTTRAQQRKKNYQLKRKKRIIKVLRFIIIVGAIYAIIFCTPFFNVKNIAVEGTKVTSAQSVITASGITQGKHILKINKKEAKAGIEKLAYVKTATIKRSFPNKVRIIIEEGKVCANIALSKGYAAIDETGKVMEISDSAKVMPIVYGLNVEKSEAGAKITIDEPARLDVILKYITQLNLQALPVPYISITAEGNDVWIELENGIDVYFGNKNDLDYKVAAFGESLRSSGDIETGYFDVSNPERIVYSTVSPNDEQPEPEQEETENTETEDEPRSE